MPVSSQHLKFWIRKRLSILIISSIYHGLVVSPYQLWFLFKAIHRLGSLVKKKPEMLS